MVEGLCWCVGDTGSYPAIAAFFCCDSAVLDYIIELLFVAIVIVCGVKKIRKSYSYKKQTVSDRT